MAPQASELMSEECDKRKTVSTLLSLLIFGIALLIVWHAIKEGTAQTDDEQCSTSLMFAQDLFNLFLWQSNSYGYLCSADVHY